METGLDDLSDDHGWETPSETRTRLKFEDKSWQGIESKCEEEGGDEHEKRTSSPQDRPGGGG